MVFLIVALTIVFLSAVILDKALKQFPLKELRRRARVQDKVAAKLYKLAAYGPSARLVLRLVVLISAAAIILVAARQNWWLGAIAAMTVIKIVWLDWRLVTDSRLVLLSGSYSAPVYSFFASLAQPLSDRFHSRNSPQNHTKIYEKDDLVELLKLQGRQVDNRIAEGDLKLAAQALSFKDKKVSDVMVPARKVKWVAGKESIGPMVMDELHKTNQIRFPVVDEVVKSGNPKVLGALYLDDLLKHLEDKGKLRDIMHPGAAYINESCNLETALHAFLQSGIYLLTVVNNFEEVVGILSVDDVIEKLMGAKLSGELDDYSDIRTLAAYENPQNRSQQNDAKVE